MNSPMLNLAHRRDAYERVLKMYKNVKTLLDRSNKKRSHNYEGMCAKLLCVLENKIGHTLLFYDNFLMDEFPELYTQKPKTCWKEKPSFWWSPFYISRRMAALEKAIEICNKKAYDKHATNLLKKES